MMLTLLKWLGMGFTGALGGLQAFLFKLAIGALAFSLTAGGAYVAGRLDCAAKHNVAALKATIAEMQERERAREAVERRTAELQEQEEKEAKRVDETLDRAEEIANRPVPPGVCATPDFLRQLRATR